MDDETMGEPPEMPEGDLTAAEMDTAGMIDPMDDLFGETADGLRVPVPLPSAPLPASLIFRVNDMQRTGCCSKLAWSNTGYVAQICEDGSKITFRTILRDRRSGKSELSEESKSPLSAPEGTRFVHIQFSGLGTDLATADNLGGVHVYTMTDVLGRLQAAPADVLVNDGIRTELDAIVGLHWLPTWPVEFRAPYITPATKVGEKWLTQMRMPDQNVPRVHHALENRNALLCVTCSSKLVLLYHDEQGIWHSTSVQLEEWQSSQELLSHAQIGEEGDHLVLITHDHDRRFRVYKITIHWSNTPQSRSNGTSTIVSPVLYIVHLTIFDHICPQQAQLAKLSLLRVIPAIPPFADQGEATATTVLAVFTHAPTALNLAQQQADAFSIIARWTVESVTPTLHECFTKLKPSGQTPAQNPSTVLRRQPDIMTNRIIVDAEALYHNITVAFTVSVGVVELYERSTWSLIEPFGDMLVASSLPQSGLEYSQGDHAAHIASNCNASAMIYANPDRTLNVKYVAPRYSWQPLEDGISDTRGMIETAVICLAREYAILNWSSAATDETLAVLPPDLSQDLRVLFVKQVLRILCRTLDVSMLDHQRQQQTVLREQIHLRALSAQLALGTKLGSVERDFAGQFAYVYLNMRQISLTMAQTFSTRDPKLSRSPDLVPSLICLVRWVTDLTMFIVDSIAQIKRDLRPGVTAKQAFERFAAKTGNPALHLLLCSFPRVLLRMQTLVIPTYLKWVDIAKTRARTVEHKQQMEDFSAMSNNLPFKHANFVELVTDFDAAVRSAYTECGASAERRVDIELAMMTEGTIPDELQPALQTLLDTVLPKFAENADMGKVYFWDTKWLGITNSVPAKGSMRYDAIRKVPLTKSMKLRLCRRCGAEMEDLPPEQLRQAPDWLKHGHRHCFCQDYWWPMD